MDIEEQAQVFEIFLDIRTNPSERYLVFWIAGGLSRPFCFGLTMLTYTPNEC